MAGRLTSFILGAALTVAAGPALARDIIFLPANDPTGYMPNPNPINEGYVDGRGIVFRPLSDFTLTDVALFIHLQGLELSYTLAETNPNPSGPFTQGPALRSGSQVVSNTANEFVGFDLTPIVLTAGTSYSLSFFFRGNATDLVFHREVGSPFRFTQDGFAGIEGTQNRSTLNDLMPRTRLTGFDGVAAGVPEPAAWALMILGFGLAGATMRRRRRALAV